MSRFNSGPAKNLALAISIIIFVPVAHSQDTTSADYVWQDGFLEKDYPFAASDIREALKTIFLKCIATETLLLEGKEGTIESWGVGDTNGKWLSWNGVSTVKELNVKEGGVVVAVKTVKKESRLTVGFKVGEGDKKSSEILHKLLANKLEKPKNKGQELILSRITAVAGNRSKVRAKIKVGDSAEGKIYDTAGLSYAQGTFTQKAPKGVKTFIVTGATAILETDHPQLGKIPLNIGGEFLVKDSLEFGANGHWDGNKEGAVHTLLGKLTMFDYEFTSDANSPLTFQLTKDGYIYVDGKGTVKDLKTGKVEICGKGKVSKGKNMSIFSFWQQTDDSELGFLGFEPKSNEVIVISKDNKINGYAAGLGIHMMMFDCIVSRDVITVKDRNLTLSYRISGDILTMKTPQGKIMKYRRLAGTDREKFIDRLFNKPDYSVDD